MKRAVPQPVTGVILISSLFCVVSCSGEQPHGVAELMEDPRLLEATVVRCAADRAELKYTETCLNAREAAERMAVREEEANRRDLEAESARKREALRRSREAAAEARRRAEEAERLRREAEYLGQFEELPANERRTGTPNNPSDPAISPGQNAPATGSAVDDELPTLDDVREALREQQRSPEN